MTWEQEVKKELKRLLGKSTLPWTVKRVFLWRRHYTYTKAMFDTKEGEGWFDATVFFDGKTTAKETAAHLYKALEGYEELQQKQAKQ